MPKSKTKKFTLEYLIRSSPLILYDFLTTATGLQQWFADEVDNEGNEFSFTWRGETERAELISTEDDDYIRYRWDWQSPEEYFEFKIDKSEITNDTILYVSDFAEERDMENAKRLWDAQIHNLIKRIGAS
jgi:uncharacterized protein YndB with AHSA1/START domain